MHELAVTENLLKTALRYGEAAAARRVTDLHLVIGELATIVGDSVQFYWDIISKGTLCEGASLHFERVPAELRCLDCGHPYKLDGALTECPACSSARVRIVAGDEFRLEAIEVEG